MAKIRVDQMGDILEAELSSYGHDVTETVKQIVKEVAEDCRRDIQNRSPKKTGRYRRGWRAETVYDGPAGIRVSVHNKTAPQITHLLENGHAKVGGGRVEGKAHIRPAEQKAERELVQKLKGALQE